MDVEVPRQDIGPGFTVGDFEIIELLGRGGMGEVYRARQKSMSRDIALKILPPSLTREKDHIARFLNEVRLAARLEHPHLVAAFEAGEDHGVHFLAMSYVRGRSLERFLAENGALDERRALELLRKVAGALRYAWQEHGLIHRDVKPSNILLDHHGEPHVTDLGLSKSLLDSQGLTVSDRIMGTPNYMSPEQAEARSNVDFRSDIYSLGATLYHMVTGQIPFKGSSVMETLRKQVAEPLPDPRQFKPAISPACVALLEFMLAKQPEKRHGSWDELLADIDRVLAGQLPSQAPLAKGDSVLLRVASDDPARQSPRQKQKRATSGAPVLLNAPTISAVAKPFRMSARWIPAIVGFLVVAAFGAWFWFFRPPATRHLSMTTKAPTGNPQSLPGLDARVLSSATTWTNSLGMPFVEVPGTGLFFCLWETRVQDYETYAKATGRVHVEPKFQQGPTHPVVNVRWDDAVAFCDWLTKTEQQSGRLLAGREYRLPTTTEWSTAAGGSRYPWGNQWPPPLGAGNYMDEACNRGRLCSNVLRGYDDGYVETAPVGSFTSSRSGLFDMGGNAAEWCLDGSDASGHVVRGKSWGNCDPALGHTAAGTGYVSHDLGFRCVLTSGTTDAVSNIVAALVGKWNVSCKWWSGCYEFLPDGTATQWAYGRTIPGTYLIDAQRLRVAWANETWDQYLLPVSGGKMTGINNEGAPVQATKMTSAASMTAQSSSATSSSTKEWTTLSNGWRVGRPVNLGAAVNSRSGEADPAISADGLTLLFASWRSGGLKGSDIWICQRQSVRADWGPAVNLGPTVNSPYEDRRPFLSADALTLLFCSSRPGGQGALDLWMSTRRQIDEPWEPPENLGPLVNSPQSDGYGCLSSDALTLIFVSNRPGGSGGSDLWACTRRSQHDTWSSPVNLGTPSNSQWEDGTPCLSSDGLALLLHSNRLIGEAGLSIRMSTRRTVGEPFGEPVDLGPEVNNGDKNGGPALSFDGRTLYFSSYRAGGEGDRDIWQVPVLSPASLQPASISSNAVIALDATR